MSKDKNNSEINLDNYKDLNGLSLRKMIFGLWLSEHRAKIIKIIIISLISISIFFFTYSTYYFIIYFLNNQSEKADNSAINSQVSSPRKVVNDLAIGTPQVFQSGSSYDFVVSIKNPNDKFSARFEYCFTSNGKNLKCDNNFILPAEEKYVFNLGQRIVDAPTLTFQIKNIAWQRIDAHKIPNWNNFASERLNLSLDGISLVLADKTAAVEKVSLDSLEFSVTNQSAYGYYEFPLNISFYRGDELIGINRYIVKNFFPNERQTVRLSWLGSLSNVSRTEIRPEVDLLNDNVYLKYQGVQ
jgi:hypothetical protein